RQHTTVTAILKAGGEIKYDYQMMVIPKDPDSLRFDWSATSPMPKWLLGLLGEDFFHDVIEVKLDNRTIPQSDFAAIAKLPELRNLTLNNTIVFLQGLNSVRGVRDSDLAELSQLHQLRTIELRDAEIMGSGLSSLTNLKHIRFLDLAHTQLDDSGMEQIAKMTSVDKLDLGFTLITDVGLNKLRNLAHNKDFAAR